jgi:hypothetical protein
VPKTEFLRLFAPESTANTPHTHYNTLLAPHRSVVLPVSSLAAFGKSPAARGSRNGEAALPKAPSRSRRTSVPGGRLFHGLSPKSAAVVQLKKWLRFREKLAVCWFPGGHGNGEKNEFPREMWSEPHGHVYTRSTQLLRHARSIRTLLLPKQQKNPTPISVQMPSNFNRLTKMVLAEHVRCCSVVQWIQRANTAVGVPWSGSSQNSEGISVVRL